MSKIRVTYTCPNCGETAVFGEHRCRAVKPKPQARGPTFRRALVVGVAWLLIGVLVFYFTDNLLFTVVLMGLLSIVGIFIARGGVVRDRYGELLRSLGNDQGLAERLIHTEQQRFPEGKREDWVERAYQNLLRDRTR